MKRDNLGRFIKGENSDRRLDLTGKRFNNLLVIELAYSKKETFWLCECSCGMTSIVKGAYLKNGHTKSCGCLKNVSGSEHKSWKENAGKDAIHTWMRKKFGKATKCENKNCDNKSKIFEWANLNNHIYKRKRKDFKMLCRSCHRKYDMTPEKLQKALDALSKTPTWNKK